MIQIVFQNNSFVVCNKPAQVLSVPARDKADPRPCLGLELQKHLGQPVYPVHRLDYEVSGLILYALTSESHRESQDWFQNKLIRKKYRAETPFQNFDHWPQNVTTDRSQIIVKPGSQFLWKTKILRGKRRSFESAHGEWAETEALVHAVDEAAKKILWDLYPITGKPHQLRLELSRRGFPILGDSLYGSTYKREEAGVALAAIEINLSGVQSRYGLPEKILLNPSN
ncbi:pseudouridine synthase family protein [Pseudobdellovibrio exovorus]|uniref:Putative pseudouridine synthase n=1 Tax=Pseudobdellovibrio exovorus JSS TaxID=1184267 RepID=M4V8Q2_9BACT|nr:pseudouridine synthase [Pseudobdellovibrio exovorus]AGH95782.1 putative pseudouridine synthase [Pseudobdellovibrio exovorus JSS]